MLEKLGFVEHGKILAETKKEVRRVTNG